MSMPDKNSRRDFVHTLDVLTATALVERELAAVSQRSLALPFGYRTFAPFAAAASIAIIVGLTAYLTLRQTESDAPPPSIAKLSPDGAGPSKSVETKTASAAPRPI